MCIRDSLYGDPETYNWVNYSWDGFYPNDAGYEKMAARFEEVLRRDAWRIVSGLGDVDGDGSVSAADAADILRASGGLIPLDERAAIAADTSPTDGGSAPGIPDAVRLLLRTQGSIPDSEWR